MHSYHCYISDYNASRTSKIICLYFRNQVESEHPYHKSNNNSAPSSQLLPCCDLIWQHVLGCINSPYRHGDMDSREKPIHGETF